MFFKIIRKLKEKACVDGDLDNRCTEHTPWKCFRYGYEYHLIEIFLKPPKDNDDEQKICFIERANRSSQKKCDNGKNNNYQKIYTYM